MHDHHGSGPAGMNLLPLWAQVLGVLLLAGVTASHAVHLIVSPGSRALRGWHITHLAMALGMLYMFAPWADSPGNLRFWQYLFAAFAVAVTGWILTQLQRGRAVDLLWVPALIGMAAMAYMFLMHNGSDIYAMTYLLAGYYLLEAAAWAQGWFVQTGDRRRSALPLAIGAPGAPADSLGGGCGPEVRVTQTVCALSMTWMFLAMDSGASEFFEKAFGAGAITEHTVWAVSGIALVLLACVPHRVVGRRTAAPEAKSAGAVSVGAVSVEAEAQKARSAQLV